MHVSVAGRAFAVVAKGGTIRLYLDRLLGRTGFDLKFEAQTACRGWFVGLVKNRAKTINADHEDLALAA